MARTTINRLSDRKVRTAKPGMHPDGGGLYLRVTEGNQDGDGTRTLTRYCLFRSASRAPFKGKHERAGQPGDDRPPGIGPLPTISPPQAPPRAPHRPPP